MSLPHNTHAQVITESIEFSLKLVSAAQGFAGIHFPISFWQNSADVERTFIFSHSVFFVDLRGERTGHRRYSFSPPGSQKESKQQQKTHYTAHCSSSECNTDPFF